MVSTAVKRLLFFHGGRWRRFDRRPRVPRGSGVPFPAFLCGAADPWIISTKCFRVAEGGAAVAQQTRQCALGDVDVVFGHVPAVGAFLRGEVREEGVDEGPLALRAHAVFLEDRVDDALDLRAHGFAVQAVDVDAVVAVGDGDKKQFKLALEVAEIQCALARREGPVVLDLLDAVFDFRRCRPLEGEAGVRLAEVGVIPFHACTQPVEERLRRHGRRQGNLSCDHIGERVVDDFFDDRGVVPQGATEVLLHGGLERGEVVYGEVANVRVVVVHLGSLLLSCRGRRF